MNGGVFSDQILADKLSKLNNTQQCIETLSHWCIFHRKNAALIAQTWDKQFRSSQKEQKIPFLNLANDILQNSKRNGNEFVEEFWKVLPAALKDVFENGGDRGKSSVTRLVNIWEERRVFGSRAQGIKDAMLGNEPLPTLDLSKKQSRGGCSVKIVRRDSRSIRTKLKVGGAAEKIVSAFHTVLNELGDENSELEKCHSAVRRVGRMEKDVNSACEKAGDPRREILTAELTKEEDTIKQCMEKLKSVELNRRILVSELKEALIGQESELEKVRTQLQLAEAILERATDMRRHLSNEQATTSSQTGDTTKSDPNGHATDGTRKSTSAIAAEVADKLAASTHSQQIMRSVLSSFAAEEAKHTSSSPGEVQTEKKQRIEQPLQNATTSTISAGAAFIPVQPVVVATTHQPQAVLVQQAPAQNPSPPVPQQYSIYPSQQSYLQPPSGVMLSMPVPYTMNSQVVAPPPPSPHLQRPAPMLMPHPSPVMPPPQQLSFNQQPMQMNGQMMAPMQFLPTPPGPPPPPFRPLQPPGMGYYPPQQQ